jgi:flagellar biosynthetic protein FlhB
MAAPVLTAKGADEMAFKIRGIAKENEIPMVENRPLARALYADVEVGQIVPVIYYQAIAQILARIRQLDEERRRVDGMRA